MTDLKSKPLGEWQVVARKTNRPIRHLIGMFFSMLLMTEPMTWSSVTWTLRHRVTGETRKVTADSEAEAELKVLAGAFD
jgi:hypothetical protein